jgi:hypothetical protein
VGALRLRWRLARWALILAAIVAALAVLGTYRPAAATTLRDAIAARRAGAAAPTSAAAATSTTPAAAAAAAAAGATCRAAVPFFWEIGSADTVLASGSVGDGAPTRTTPINIASASKWLYAAYVVERGLQPADAPFLHLTSGYVACETTGTNGTQTAAEVGRFSYGGGHMQRLAATQQRTAGLTPAQLGDEIAQTLGIPLTYVEAQPAGGARISAAGYATFLHALMVRRLQLGGRLGETTVCTNPATCKTADRSPVPVSWGYSLGHWVEAPDGDGAFSSPGAFGFYPWISADRRLYGVLARSGKPAAWAGAKCGAAIRQAFVAAGGAPK